MSEEPASRLGDRANRSTSESVVYGKGAGKWTLKAAREKWESIRTWSRETGRDPRELRRGQPGADGERGPSKTLQDAIDGFLDSKRSLKEFTLTNYRRQLQNQVTDVIPAMTPLRELEWDRGGRERSKSWLPLSKTEAVTTRHFACRRSWHRHWTTQSSRGGCRETRTQQPSRREKRANTTPSTTHISSGNRCLNCCRQSTSTAALVMSRQCWHSSSSS